jgi:hypothetical protein
MMIMMTIVVMIMMTIVVMMIMMTIVLCPHKHSSYISYTIEVMSKDKGGFSIIISKHHHPSVYITAVELIYGDMHLVVSV